MQLGAQEVLTIDAYAAKTEHVLEEDACKFLCLLLLSLGEPVQVGLWVNAHGLLLKVRVLGRRLLQLVHRRFLIVHRPLAPVLSCFLCARLRGEA